MRKCRVGIIGLGKVATFSHLPGYKQTQNIEVVAGAEIREDVLRTVSAEYGFKGYTDFEEMLKKEKLDIAVITTGPVFTRKITEKVAENGANVLVEKPMALTLEDAKAIIKKCEKEGVKLAYGETFRFIPAIKKAKEIIDQGLLGNLHLLIEIVVGGQGPENFQKATIYPPGAPGAGRTGLTDHGIHLVDIFRWFTGSEVDWVCGRGNRAGSPPHTEWCSMVFKNGVIGQLIINEATFPATLPNEGIFGLAYSLRGVSIWNPFPQIVQVHGSKGALRIFAYPNKLYLVNAETNEQLKQSSGPYRFEEIQVRSVFHPDHFGLQIDSYANRILKGEEPEISGLDGLKALQVILAAYESFENQKIVKLGTI
ncbi:MAG: Gfo/Idh/MocA family oxidoreductase [Candidatus Bathyarchaeia archaeon]